MRLMANLNYSLCFYNNCQQNTSIDQGKSSNYKINNNQLSGDIFQKRSSSLASITFSGNEKNFNTFKSIIQGSYSSDPDRIVKFLSNIDLKSDQYYEMLLNITKDDKVSGNFIKALTSNPRSSGAIVKMLVDKLGGQKLFVNWMTHPEGYLNAYKKFLNSFYRESKTVEDLLSFQPNWTIWSIKDKYKEKNANTNFIIGKVPDNFGGSSAFYQLVDKLKNYNTDIQIINGYKIEPLKSGLSDKKSYKITFNNKAFVIKIDNNPNHALDSEEHKENKVLKSDSVMLNAVIDFYLNKHNCQNAPKLLFYDYYNNVSLYEFANGKLLNNEHEHKIGDYIKDYSNLGIIYNDLQIDNFISDDKKNITVIDSGESVFIDALRPGSPNLTYNLPNFSGQDYANILAGTLLRTL